MSALTRPSQKRPYAYLRLVGELMRLSGVLECPRPAPGQPLEHAQPA